MTNINLGDEVWIISFEIDNDFYLLSRQTITELLADQVVCEDDFNTFHVSYDDIYTSKAAALSAMIERLQQLEK